MNNLLEPINKYEEVKANFGKNSSIIVDDKQYLDFFNDNGVNSLGCGHPILLKNLLETAIDGILHVPKMYTEKHRESLSCKIADIINNNYLLFDYNNPKIFFNNSGTEANELAIKAARLFYQKRNNYYKFKIASPYGSFFGRTGFSSAASDSTDSPYHKIGFGPFPQGFCHFNTIKQLWNLYNESPPGLAAVMMSPILGNNCISYYPQSFWNDLAVFLDETETLLIFDEIQTGMGRTGKYFGMENYIMFPEPDIITLGKGMAAGLPLSATIMRNEIADCFDKGSHFNTFGGNILSCVASLTLLDYLKNRGLGEITSKGKCLRCELNGVKGIKNIIGDGLYVAFELEGDIDSRLFCRKALDNGLIITAHRRDAQIKLTPPLIITEKEIIDAVNIIDKTYNEIKKVRDFING